MAFIIYTKSSSESADSFDELDIVDIRNERPPNAMWFGKRLGVIEVDADYTDKQIKTMLTKELKQSTKIGSFEMEKKQWNICKNDAKYNWKKWGFWSKPILKKTATVDGQEMVTLEGNQIDQVKRRKFKVDLSAVKTGLGLAINSNEKELALKAKIIKVSSTVVMNK